jgi:Ribosomal protein S3, C-terminal domain
MTHLTLNFGLDFYASKRMIYQYLTSPTLEITANNNIFYAPEFEKKLMHSGFKKSFGQHLPLKADLKLGLAVCDADQDYGRQSHRAYSPKIKDALNLNGFKGAYSYKQPKLRPELKINPRYFLKNALVRSGLQLLSAAWLLQNLKEQLSSKRGARAVLNSFMRDFSKLMVAMPGTCPILGVRLLATGRLGKRKKAMAQQISRSVGKVPLSSLRRPVDYAQSFVTTPLGSVGLKVWICYAFEEPPLKG